MRILFALVLLLGGAWLQASPLNALLPVRLDPLLVLAVAWGVGSGPRGGALFGLAAGACQDLVIGAGLFAGAPLMLVGWIAGLLKPVLFYRQAPIVLPLIALCTLLKELVFALGISLTAGRLPVERLAEVLAPEILGNVLMAWPLYGLVRAGLKQTQDRWGMRPEGL